MEGLVEERVRATIEQNTATSYGLTLVVGRPFPREFTSRVEDVQRKIGEAALGKCMAYRQDHLHATLIAPIRSKKRASPSLRQDELPADWQRFIGDLRDIFVAYQPFEVAWEGVRLSEEGVFVVSESCKSESTARDLVGLLTTCVGRYRPLDPPKHAFERLHIVIGYLNDASPFLTDRDGDRFRQDLDCIQDVKLGQTTIDRIWLVHYKNRTLREIEGAVAFEFGRPFPMSPKRVLQALRIL